MSISDMFNILLIIIISFALAGIIFTLVYTKRIFNSITKRMRGMYEKETITRNTTGSKRDSCRTQEKFEDD